VCQRIKNLTAPSEARFHATVVAKGKFESLFPVASNVDKIVERFHIVSV